ncbi:MAG: ATP-dependent DNA ligase [Saprospiraceae bacterium]
MHFATLFKQLDQTTKTTVKVEALVDFFKKAPDRDKLWAIAILSHRRPKRTVKTSELRAWAAETAGVPAWLFEESYHVVGDLAETIALLLPPPKEKLETRLSDLIDIIKNLKGAEEEEKKETIIEIWSKMDAIERFVFNKLITGGFRMGVSQKLMMKALAKTTSQEESQIAHRLMGNWSPDETTFQKLIVEDHPLDDVSKPYPFYLAHPLEDGPDDLGAESEWVAERKWDGIRGQLIIRKNEWFLWSRGEELVTDKFPELEPLCDAIPNGTVLDAEILPFKNGIPLTFNDLQTRIGRKNVTKKILEAAPVVLMAYDVLEWEGKDIRDQPLEKRRVILEKLTSNPLTSDLLKLSEKVFFSKWEELKEVREKSREFHSEGLMLKRKDSPYLAGRKRGDWWKWKVDPLTVDAVMLYAQSGHGRRANLYTDFTFAVWDGDNLVPFAKAYSGLTDKEFNEITRWVRKHTKERFGPVRSVDPELVFEIAFEGINESSRHKSGIALRFPRMLRWRRDKPASEANTLQDLHQMLEQYG